jgi:predicted Rossmann fold nucleotide-binding protein DprA/Smf involved in DNA uptake
MKVALIGSRRYENKKKIKDFVFKLKQQYGDDTIIVSGGCKQGADRYAKKYALELGLQYEEYPPFHEVHNLYCTLPESRYDKPFSMRNFFARNKILVGTSDFIVAFIPEGVEARGTMNALEYGKKLGKKRIIIS